jgi:hypothetical protein
VWLERCAARIAASRTSSLAYLVSTGLLNLPNLPDNQLARVLTTLAGF